MLTFHQPIRQHLYQTKDHWCRYQNHSHLPFSQRNPWKLPIVVNLASNGHQDLVANHGDPQALDHRHPPLPIKEMIEHYV